MAKNEFSFSLSDEQISEVNDALNKAESGLIGLIALDAMKRRRLTKMGRQSQVFCSRALGGVALNPLIVPPSLDLANALAKMEALKRLAPIADRLRWLVQRCVDTQTAVGSDVMSAALEAYGLLKVSGKGRGLDGLHKELATRWSKKGRDLDPEPEPDPT